MKKSLIFLLSLCLLPAFLGGEDEVKQNVVQIKSLVEAKHLDEPSQSLFQVFSQIIPLVSELNRKEILPENILSKKQAISELLKKAASLQSDPRSSSYLTALSEDILNNDYSSSGAKWLDLDHNRINFIFRFHKKQKKYDAFIFTGLPAASKTAGKYLSFSEKIKASTLSKLSSLLMPVKIVDQFLIADLLGATAYTHFILLHPQTTVELNPDSRKIIVFRNLTREFFNRVIKPVSAGIFGASLNKKVHYRPYFTHLVLHQVTHYLGPYFVESRSEQPVLISQKLKRYFSTIEEIKADTMALAAIPSLKEDKTAALPGELRIYATYVTVLVSRIRSGPGDTPDQSALIELNFLFKNGGVVYNLDSDTILIDIQKFRKAVNLLLATVVNIEKGGRLRSAKQFIKEHAVLIPEIKRIIIKNENLPKSVVFQ